MYPLTYVEEVIMKKILLLFTTAPFLIVLSYTNLRAEEPRETVIQYYEASMIGDVGTMRRLSGGPFYNRRKVLLEKNKSYPEYLIKFYSGVEVKAYQSDIGNAKLVKKNHIELYNKHYSKQANIFDESKESVPDKVAVVTVN